MLFCERAVCSALAAGRIKKERQRMKLRRFGDRKNKTEGNKERERDKCRW